MFVFLPACTGRCNWVARMQDLGVNDTQYHCRTHLGHLLKTGDTALGYELPCS